MLTYKTEDDHNNNNNYDNKRKTKRQIEESHQGSKKDDDNLWNFTTSTINITPDLFVNFLCPTLLVQLEQGYCSMNNNDRHNNGNSGHSHGTNASKIYEYGN